MFSIGIKLHPNTHSHTHAHTQRLGHTTAFLRAHLPRGHERVCVSSHGYLSFPTQTGAIHPASPSPALRLCLGSSPFTPHTGGCKSFTGPSFRAAVRGGLRVGLAAPWLCVIVAIKVLAAGVAPAWRWIWSRRAGWWAVPSLSVWFNNARKSRRASARPARLISISPQITGCRQSEGGGP